MCTCWCHTISFDHFLGFLVRLLVTLWPSMILFVDGIDGKFNTTRCHIGSIPASNTHAIVPFESAHGQCSFDPAVAMLKLFTSFLIKSNLCTQKLCLIYRKHCIKEHSLIRLLIDQTKGFKHFLFR